MTKKVLLLSDTHLHEFPECGGMTEKGHSRLLDGLSILDQATEHMLQEGITYGIHLGDIFHIHDRVLTSAAAGLARWARTARSHGHKWIFLVGNHDCDLTGHTHALEPFRELFTVVDQPTTVEVLDATFGLVPWLHKVDRFNSLPEQLKEPDVVLLHHDFADIPYRNKLIGRAGSPSLFHNSLVISGHYHDNGGVYLGAPMQHNWGDRGKKRGMFELILGTERELRYVKTKYPKFVVLPLAYVLSKKEEVIGKIRDNFLRILCEGQARHSAIDEGVSLATRMGARSVQIIHEASVDASVSSEKLEDVSVFDFEDVVDAYVDQYEGDLSPKLLKKIGKKAIRKAA